MSRISMTVIRPNQIKPRNEYTQFFLSNLSTPNKNYEKFIHIHKIHRSYSTMNFHCSSENISD